MISLFVFIYILLGIISVIYIWNKFYAQQYEDMKKLQLANDSMVIIWIIVTIIAWPFVLLNYRK